MANFEIEHKFFVDGRIKLVYVVYALYSPSGLERVLTQKANWLAQTGRYDVTIVTSRQRGLPPAFSLHPEVKTVDIGANYYSFIGKIQFKCRLRRLLRQIAPDVVDSLCGPRLGELSRLKGPFAKIAEFHFSYGSMYTRDCKPSVARAFRRLAGRFDRFVVLTKDDAADWAPYARNVVQIYNPCELDGRCDPEAKSVCLVGRLEVQKNIADAVTAWKTVAARFPDWTLDVYGEGKQRKMLEKMIADGGLEGKVILHGAVKNIHEMMCRSSVLVMSSLYEGFPMSLLEGAALGMPLVSYDCKCGPKEIISDGVNGFLVPQGEVSFLAGRLMELMGSPEMRLRMGEESGKISGKFRVEPIMQEWDRLFAEIC